MPAGSRQEALPETISNALEAARRAVNAFDGSETSFVTVMEAVSSYETTLGDHFGKRIPPEQEERHIARFGLEKKDTVAGLLDHAINLVYGMLARLGTLRDQLAVLEAGGALVRYYDDIFVLPDPQPVKVNPEEQDSGPHEFVRQPRLAIIVKLLQGLGIYSDDLIIRVGKIFEDTVRQLPYVLIDIPRLGRQISVCDQYAQVTFISQGIHRPGFWSHLQKNQLKQYPGIYAVPFDEMPDRLGPLLFEDGPAVTAMQTRPKVDTQAFEAQAVEDEKKPYSEEEIEQWVKHHKEITGRYPSSHYGGVVLRAPWLVWSQVNTYLRYYKATSLSEFLHERGMENYPLLSLRKIYRVLLRYHKNGNRLTPTSGFIPELGTDAKNIDNALKLGLRGLPAVGGMYQLLVRRGQITEKPSLSEPMIALWALNHVASCMVVPSSKARRKNMLPAARGKVTGADYNETWLAVEKALVKAGRGIRKKTNLRKFLKEKKVDVLAGIARPLRVNYRMRTHKIDYIGPASCKVGCIRSAAEEVTRFVLNAESIPEEAVSIVEGILQARKEDIVKEQPGNKEHLLYVFPPKANGQSLEVVYVAQNG